MSESGRCATCGQALPCESCAPQAVSTATFRLLPCPIEELIDEEERFTSLLREVKADVIRRAFVEQHEGGALLERARRLGRLVESEDWPAADAAAGQCLDDVLEFPRRDRRRVSLPVVLCVVALCVVVGLVCMLMR